MMELIGGVERRDLEELVKQLREHGAGGGSAELSAAMAKFHASSTHDLALWLANRLLGFEVTVYGGGGGGRCIADPQTEHRPSAIGLQG